MTTTINNIEQSLKQAANSKNQEQYFAGLLSLNAVVAIVKNADSFEDTPMEFWSTVGNLFVKGDLSEKSMTSAVISLGRAFSKQVGRKMDYSEKDLCGMLYFSCSDLWDSENRCCKVFYTADDFCALTSGWEQVVSIEDYKQAFNTGWQAYLKVKGKSGWATRLDALKPDYFANVDVFNDTKAAEAATYLGDAFIAGGKSHGLFDTMG